MVALFVQDPIVSSAVIEQRLRTNRLRRRPFVRPKPAPRAFVRIEPISGERFEVDWGHFGALDY
jgi:hypothetical protein